jgi:hypothetical protein
VDRDDQAQARLGVLADDDLLVIVAEQRLGGRKP